MPDYLGKTQVYTRLNGDVAAVICDGVTPAQKLAINASGQITIAAIVGALPAGAATIGNVGIIAGTAIIGQVKITDGTNPAATINSSDGYSLGAVVTKWGTDAKAATTPAAVRLTDGTNFISPTNPLAVEMQTVAGDLMKSTLLEQTNLAAAGEHTFEGLTVTNGKTGSLLRVLVTAIGRLYIKIVVDIVDTIPGHTTENSPVYEFRALDRGEFTIAGDGSKQFHVYVKNIDTEALDVRCIIEHTEY